MYDNGYDAKSNTTNTESIENDKKTRCWTSIKIATVILCIFGFVCNSFIIFKQFISKETVTSNDINVYSALYLPSVTMCGLSGFKEEVNDYSDLDLDKYVNNTIHLKEMLLSLSDLDNNTLIVIPFRGTIFDKSARWKISTTYSAYRGRCYTIEYQKEVTESIG